MEEGIVSWNVAFNCGHSCAQDEYAMKREGICEQFTETNFNNKRQMSHQWVVIIVMIYAESTVQHQCSFTVARDKSTSCS